MWQEAWTKLKDVQCALDNLQKYTNWLLGFAFDTKDTEKRTRLYEIAFLFQKGCVELRKFLKDERRAENETKGL
jgi:hypothetical protein